MSYRYKPTKTTPPEQSHCPYCTFSKGVFSVTVFSEADSVGAAVTPLQDYTPDSNQVTKAPVFNISPTLNFKNSSNLILIHLNTAASGPNIIAIKVPRQLTNNYVSLYIHTYKQFFQHKLLQDREYSFVIQRHKAHHIIKVIFLGCSTLQLEFSVKTTLT